MLHRALKVHFKGGSLGKHFLSTALLLILLPATAQAHKLLVEYQYLTGGKVRIESRFETGDVPFEAAVVIYRTDNKVLREGVLDARGLFVFPIAKAEELVVEVTDETGHRAEAAISAKELAAGMGRDAASMLGACLFAPPAPLASLNAGAVLLAPETIAEPDLLLRDTTGPPLLGVLLGVGLLLGLAAGFYVLQRSRSATTPRI